MASTKIYDVIIVGGGPAGSTAGFLSSNYGLKVLLIDKSTFPRHKLCGGCITDKTVKLLGRVFGDTVEHLKEKGVINFESSHFEIFYKDRSLLKKKSPVPFYFVERHLYDSFLLNRAQQSGVEIITGDDVIFCDTSNNVIRTASGRVFTGRFIMGADGVNSFMRRQFPDYIFNRTNWQKNTGTALEIFVPRSGMPAMNHPTLYLDFIRQGYAWVFPNKDKFIAGIGGIAQKNGKQVLPSFFRFLSVLNIRNPGAYRAQGYAFPYGNYLLKPAFRNIILVGDAAGFADPLLGEGIFYAQRSAEFASQAIYEAIRKNDDRNVMGRQATERYIGLLQKDIYPEFEYAQKIRKFMFTYFNKFHYLPLKVLMNVLGTKTVEAVHGIRSYKWFRKK